MVDFLLNELTSCFAYDTCHHSYQNKWSIHNLTAGHCAVAALIIQDYCGGEIYKIKIGRNTHFYNVINNKIIDCTSEQFTLFNIGLNYDNSIFVDRKRLLKIIDVKNRYNILKNRLHIKLKGDVKF